MGQLSQKIDQNVMEKIKWGILGCGDVTEIKSGPAFNLIDKSELVAVMRRDAVKAKDYAKRHKVAKWYSNADDLINDSEVNAVYVATPPDAHAELTIKALRAGKPVYVEKPMALTYAQCQQMIQASEEYQTPLFVAYYRRALPGFLKVKELVDSRSIGSIRFVNIRYHASLTKEELAGDLPWRVKPEIAGGGHFFDMAAHHLDYLDFLFGPVQKVRSLVLNQAQKYSAEDMVSASFLMPDGIVVLGNWSFTVPEFLATDTIEIIGDKGQIKFSCFDFVPIELTTSQGRQSFDYPKPEHVQQFLIQNIVDDLLGKGKSPSNGVSGSRTNRVMEEVVKEYYSDKR